MKRRKYPKILHVGYTKGLAEVTDVQIRDRKKIGNFKDKHHNKGLQFIMTGGYLIICGIVNNEDPDTYMITSGNTKIQDHFERNKYFIKEYVLGNPNEFKIEPFK